jgi:hypothetical protein
MLAIFAFLLIGATSTIVLLRWKWAPKVNASTDDDAVAQALPASGRTRA